MYEQSACAGGRGWGGGRSWRPLTLAAHSGPLAAFTLGRHLGTFSNTGEYPPPLSYLPMVMSAVLGTPAVFSICRCGPAAHGTLNTSVWK